MDDDYEINESCITKYGKNTIEKWIEQTLKMAETKDIPGILLKPEAIYPLIRYGIQRD